MGALVKRSRFLDDFFKDFSTGYLIRPLHGDPLPSPGQIKIDVKDSGDTFVVHADMPGVRKEDIQVDVNGNVVTLYAEVNQLDQQKNDDKCVHTERYVGSISRSFSLSSEVDKSKAKAKCENGVLTLTLPKLKAKKSSRLQVE